MARNEGGGDGWRGGKEMRRTDGVRVEVVGEEVNREE